MTQPTIAEIRERARNAAKPNCKHCNGMGIKHTHKDINGNNPCLIICDCAASGFPELIKESKSQSIIAGLNKSDKAK
jgi:hypothetical protein